MNCEFSRPLLTPDNCPLVLTRSLDQCNKFWSLVQWKKSSNALTRPFTAWQLPFSPRIWTKPCISLKDFVPEQSGRFFNISILLLVCKTFCLFVFFCCQSGSIVTTFWKRKHRSEALKCLESAVNWANMASKPTRKSKALSWRCRRRTVKCCWNIEI